MQSKLRHSGQIGHGIATMSGELWTQPLSVIVENAAPTDVIITFPSAKNFIATDVTCTVNGSSRVVSSASWTGSVWTVVLASPVYGGDVVVITFVKNGISYTVTNNTLSWQIVVTGRTSGTATSGTIVIGCTEDITPTVTGDVTISVARSTEAPYKIHTITVNCPNNLSGSIVFPDRTKIKTLGNYNVGNPYINFYAGNTSTAPIVTFSFDNRPEVIVFRQNAAMANTLIGSGTKAWSDNLIHLYITGANLTWINSSRLPAALNFVYINSSSTDWTTLDFSGASNFGGTFTLADWRVVKLSSADMITLFTSLTNRVGSLPATITINDFLDYAAPPAGVTAAVNALKAAKSITTVNLGA